MSTAKYQKLPTSPPSRSSKDIGLKPRRSSSLESSNASSSSLFGNEDSSERGALRHHLPAYDSDPRFYQPKPSLYSRAALLIFIVAAFYVAFTMRADIWRSIIGQEEKRIQGENEKWAEWAAAQCPIGRGLVPTSSSSPLGPLLLLIK